MGSGLTKKAIEQAAASSAKVIEDNLLNALNDLGSGADYLDDLQDDLEKETNKALEDATKKAKKGFERLLDTIFYDYIVQSPWFKKEWKDKYEKAKKTASRWAEYGPPFREERNEELLEELAEQTADVMLVHRCLMDKADPNYTTADHDSNTALHYCCLNGHDTCLTLLLKAGADVNAINKLHQTPLMLAAGGKQKRHVSMVKTLVRHGAKVNLKDKAGNTALINSLLILTTDNSVEIVRFLLKHGATTYITPKYLTVPDPDPVAILGERIEQQDAVQLLQGRAVVRGPRLLWTSDEKLHELFRVRQEVAKRREQLALESQQNSAAAKAVKIKQREIVRKKNLDMKKTRAYARVLAREEEKWDAMRESVVSYADEEMRRYFSQSKVTAEGGKEWKRESAMTWVAHGRAGKGHELSEQEKKLALFNKRLHEFKNNLRDNPASM